MSAHPGAHAAPADADSVRALEKARGEALMRADTTALSRMTADDFVEISRLGQLRTKADNLRGFPFAGRIWYTRIFVRRDGRWQAVAMQHTMIP